MRLVQDTMITAAIVVGLVLSWQVAVLVLVTLMVLAAGLAVLPGRAGRFRTAVTIALPVAGGPLLLFIGTSMLRRPWDAMCRRSSACQRPPRTPISSTASPR
jgi:ABC-type multidrug transport system fused ATPase/permease subunit